MWEFLKSLPVGWAITILILGILAIIIVSLWGKLKAKFGKEEISLGGGKEDSPKSEKQKESSAHAPKRSCGDCVLILMGEREKYELQFRKEHDRILKTQMVFVEQKLIELQTLLINSWNEDIHISTKNGATTVDESVQHKLVYGLLKDALIGLKDEIRRSLKDNGFYDLNSSEFSDYVKERIRVIVSMLVVHIQNIYPDRGGVLEITDIIGGIQKNTYNISNLISDAYYHAKDMKMDADNRIENLTKDFGQWVDKFTLR
jgi:hypothetical protein